MFFCYYYFTQRLTNQTLSLLLHRLIRTKKLVAQEGLEQDQSFYELTLNFKAIFSELGHAVILQHPDFFMNNAVCFIHFPARFKQGAVFINDFNHRINVFDITKTVINESLPKVTDLLMPFKCAKWLYAHNGIWLILIGTTLSITRIEGLLP